MRSTWSSHTLRVAGRHRRAVIDPAVAEHLTLTRYQHGLASGVSDACNGQRALFLAVLVIAYRRLNSAFVFARVDRMTGDVSKECIKSTAVNLAPIQCVKERIFVLNVGKARIPVLPCDPVQLFFLDFRNNLRALVGNASVGCSFDSV
jgi:hypothetical protein